MKTRALILCYRIARGYGVDAVVIQHALELSRRGHEVHVACVEQGSPPNEITIHTLIPESEVLAKFIELLQPTHVIAHTEPWMSLLAQQKNRHYQAYVWEHGDPTPELIPTQLKARSAEKLHKLSNVYPNVDRVFAISEFIRSDIKWPSAEVVYNGLDLLEKKPKLAISENTKNHIRVGTLMRLGALESLYKGSEAFLSMVSIVRETQAPIKFFVMGKGTEKDARIYRDQQVEVHLNSSDDEKINYIRGLDIFVTSSLWEGFNLPLIEAQTLGVTSLAFDTGAHPEVCPLIFSSVSEMACYLIEVSKNPSLLNLKYTSPRDFVIKRFSYSRAIDALEAAFEGQVYEIKTGSQISTFKLFLWGAREAIHSKGIKGFIWWYIKKVIRKMLNRV